MLSAPTPQLPPYTSQDLVFFFFFFFTYIESLVTMNQNVLARRSKVHVSMFRIKMGICWIMLSGQEHCLVGMSTTTKNLGSDSDIA